MYISAKERINVELVDDLDLESSFRIRLSLFNEIHVQEKREGWPQLEANDYNPSILTQQCDSLSCFLKTTSLKCTIKDIYSVVDLEHNRVKSSTDLQHTPNKSSENYLKTTISSH